MTVQLDISSRIAAVTLTSQAVSTVASVSLLARSTMLLIIYCVNSMILQLLEMAPLNLGVGNKVSHAHDMMVDVANVAVAPVTEVLGG